MEYVNETLLAFLENNLQESFTTSGHKDYQKNEFEQLRIYPFRILSKAILHLLNYQIVSQNSKINK